MGWRRGREDADFGPLGCVLRVVLLLAIIVAFSAAFDGQLGVFSIPVLVAVAAWALWNPTRWLIRRVTSQDG